MGRLRMMRMASRACTLNLPISIASQTRLGNSKIEIVLAFPFPSHDVVYVYCQFLSIPAYTAGQSIRGKMTMI
jgi:hypothetical protein